MNKPKKQVRCPACDSSQTYIRISTRQIVCTKCGTVSKLEMHEQAA